MPACQVPTISVISAAVMLAASRKLMPPGPGSTYSSPDRLTPSSRTGSPVRASIICGPAVASGASAPDSLDMVLAIVRLVRLVQLRRDAGHAGALQAADDRPVGHEPLPDLAGAQVLGGQQRDADVDADHVGIDPAVGGMERVCEPVAAVN